MFRRTALFALILLLSLSGLIVVAQQSTERADNVAIIMDASGSMQALIGGGQSRLTVAKNSIATLSNELPESTNASLWAYGHRLGQEDPAASCRDIEEVISLSPIDAEAFSSTVAGINAIGYTPIADTLQRVAESLPQDERNTIVLMSDGEESCGGDPCEVARALAENNINLVVNTIGFAADSTTRAQLQCIAEASGGTYYDAQNADALLESLREASQPTPLPPTATPLPLPTETPVPEVSFTTEDGLPFNVSNSAQAARNPRAAFDGAGNLHVTWEDRGLDGIAHRLRTPSGEWSNIRMLSDDFNIAFRATGLLMPRPDGAMCVLFNGTTDIDGQGDTFGSLYQECYLDDTWSELELIRRNQGSPRAIRAAYDADGTLEIVRITGDGVVYEKEDGTDELLSDGLQLTSFLNFVIDSNWHFHVIYMRLGSPATVVHRYSTDRGQTWSERETINGDFNAQQYAVTADMRGRLHATFTPGSGQVMYRSWTQEFGWTDTVELRQGQIGTAGVGAIAAGGSDNAPHVAWSGNNGVAYTRQIDDRWTLPNQIHDETDSAVTPALAIDREGMAHLFYVDASTEARDLLYTQPEFTPFAERDTTLTPEGTLPFNISDMPMPAEAPVMAEDNAGNLHVIWRDNSLREFGSGLVHRLRTPQGEWSAMTNLTETFNSWFERTGQLIKRPDGNVCVVFMGTRNRGGTAQLWQNCFVNGDFTGLEVITANTGNRPEVAIDSQGNIHLVYIRRGDNLIYYNVATDTQVELGDGVNVRHLDFVIDINGTLHMTYLRQGDPFSVVHRYSTDNGVIWSDRNDINGDLNAAAYALAADNRGGVHAAFNSGRANGVQYQYWHPDTGWTAPLSPQQEQPGSIGPVSMAAAPDNTAHIAWSTRSGVYYTRQTDEFWTVPELIHPDTNQNVTPGLFVGADGTVHLIYQDTSTEPRDLYYTQP